MPRAAAASVLAASLLSFPLAGPAISGPLDDALAAYERGDFNEPYRRIMRFAEKGVAKARDFVGFMRRSSEKPRQRELLDWGDQGSAGCGPVRALARATGPRTGASNEDRLREPRAAGGAKRERRRRRQLSLDPSAGISGTLQLDVPAETQRLDFPDCFFFCGDLQVAVCRLHSPSQVPGACLGGR